MEIIARKKLSFNQKEKIIDKKQIEKFIMFYERITKNMLKNFGKEANTVVNIDTKYKLKSIKFN